ncbi:hypothetical protein RJ641_033027 [Dillenia turbinata]|uniref:Uncharacterized protein n=1 Tax=Dillenia turbinata TaxID=194707 RepID=A0AAN8VYW5_9MAGN
MKGAVLNVDANGAPVDITAKSSAYLPVQEACIHKIKHVEEAGVVPGIREEFVIFGENDDDLKPEVNPIVGANKGGVVALVEDLRAFVVSFSQVSTVSP